MLTLAIQAGGNSSRMGQDKALMPFLGRPLIQYVIERLSPLADEIIVTTNRPEAYALLAGVRLVPDLRPGRGALGGLHTALACASHPLVAVVACDMPFASPAIFRHACQVIEESGADVAIPSSGEGLEPLHAIYRRATCLPLIEAALDANQWKLISWFEQAKIRVLEPGEISSLEPEGLAFRNLNTPEEFKLAEERARELS